MSDPYVEFPVDQIVDVHWKKPPSGGVPPGDYTITSCQSGIISGSILFHIGGSELLGVTPAKLIVPEPPQIILPPPRPKVIQDIMDYIDQRAMIVDTQITWEWDVTASFSDTDNSSGGGAPPHPWESISNIDLTIECAASMNGPIDINLGNYVEGDGTITQTTVKLLEIDPDIIPTMTYSGTAGGSYTGPLIWSPFYAAAVGQGLAWLSGTTEYCTILTIQP